MRTATYKELPEELRACFGRDKRATCGACWDKHPDAARLCLMIRGGRDGHYIRLPGHDPIRVTLGPGGGPVYTVEPEEGPQPPPTEDPRRALIFAERSDNTIDPLPDGTGVNKNLFPTTLYG